MSNVREGICCLTTCLHRKYLFECCSISGGITITTIAKRNTFCQLAQYEKFSVSSWEIGPSIRLWSWPLGETLWFFCIALVGIKTLSCVKYILKMNVIGWYNPCLIRNHLNDIENIIPFVLIGAFYVITQPTPSTALWHFRIFAASRFAHTVTYQVMTSRPLFVDVCIFFNCLFFFAITNNKPK